MSHVDGKIRVKRKGAGSTAVSTDFEDINIGKGHLILEWIKRPDGDGDCGDDFAFNSLHPLEKLPPDLFKIQRVEDHKVTVEYMGCEEPREWRYMINVIDVSAKGIKSDVRSNGSATIKNH